MSRPRLIRGLALLLVALLVAPAPLLLAPRPAHAVLGVGDTVAVLSDTSITSILTEVKSAISAVANVATQASTYALYIDKYVLEPLAFIESGNLLKSITAGVLKFVSGQANGSGAPQFVQNLQGHLQNVGDTQALSFLVQFGKNSNSPFASSITNALRTKYLQQTSLGGFFAANQCTLGNFSPNINSFLAGDWSKGGAGAWLALTTQPQNNPFDQYAHAQAELSTLVTDQVSSQLSQLSWGQGFLSWCDGGSGGSSGVGQSCSDFENGSDCPGQLVCVAGSGGTGTCQVPTAAQSDAVTQTQCVNKDGTTGTVQTPGSTIKNSLDKALGLQWDKVVSFGNEVGPEINSIAGSIQTVMQTVNFATELLGGSSGTGGLAGVASPSSSSARSALENFQSGTGSAGGAGSGTGTYLGISPTSVAQTSAVQGASGADLATRADQYESSWNAIAGAANTASAALAQLQRSCSEQSSAAQNALTSEVNPVLQQVQQAAAVVANARALIAKVQSEATSADSTAYTQDLQAMQFASPSATDLAQAEQDATAIGGATASPSGSLTVSGGTIVDRMNLITKNAQTLSACFFLGSLLGG